LARRRPVFDSITSPVVVDKLSWLWSDHKISSLEIDQVKKIAKIIAIISPDKINVIPSFCFLDKLRGFVFLNASMAREEKKHHDDNCHPKYWIIYQ
jgi:hypothetical protein